MFVIATDLDRTLLANGNQEYDNSMHIFNEIVKREKSALIYVTGRNVKEVKEAMIEYHAPLPTFLIAEVGTKIYTQEHGEFNEDKEWINIVKSVTSNWSIDNFKEELSIIKSIRIQEKEHQNPFKISFYLDELHNAELIVKECTKIIKSISKEALVIFSIDETNNIGLLDIIPKNATKLRALEYIRKNNGYKKEDIIYCGDSGNDILPITFGYKSILVRNATNEVKKAVKNICFEKNCIDTLYIAKGYGKLNGYYVSGIIEGLIKLNIVPQKYIQ
ncbi:MAG: HAD-IIB family hydrolase [Nanoarchaeota archaeon]|nr:HAD-IIB family hydrolase [Nanoarchaeota archaeon]